MTLYYEMHVTIEFPGEEHIENLKEIAKINSFHMGDLLLMKNEDERSHKDLFFTGRVAPSGYEPIDYVMAQNLVEIATQTFCRVLYLSGYKVVRYKIEDTVCDSKIEDMLRIMSNG